MREQTTRRNVQKLRVLACSAALTLAVAVDAAFTAEREHAAHVHGLARLNVAVEGGTVEMELLVPGADIVGFEHAPETAEQRAAVQKAAATLSDAASLFAFQSEAECRAEEAQVESALLEHDPAKEGEHEDGEAHSDEEHAEFHARYRFQCERPDGLSHVEIRLFEHFPATRELVVQTISARGQSAQELTPSAARLKF